ncbi:CpaF family protein [Candidatus Woesearchaeota archaeon]|nr:CpaF family protein [Candidatus Woesearchaeota archaeon]
MGEEQPTTSSVPAAKQRAPAAEGPKILEQYSTQVRNIQVNVVIEAKPDSYTSTYGVSISGISKTTEIILEEIREELIRKMELEDLSVDESTGEVDRQFDAELNRQINLYFAYEADETKNVLRSYILSRSLGMGYVDFLLHDVHLEEIAIDNAHDPIWVYHRKWGWLQTNIYMSSEDQIQQAASRIGRNVGRQINTLNPLLDAFLSSGERVNATISPITPRGNTITLRKFSDDPWTITKFVQNKTISSEVAAMLWQAIQFEMSILVVGGTASGKTSTLNALANFIPPNQRIISIEDTRELRLASYLYWVPMMTRLPNAEGKGAVSMEDLLVNSLRMRPDRILVGEVRRKAEAETLFEAIHTGHSCYGTFHANDAREAVARLTNDPVNVPKALLPAINLLLVQFRNRRTGKRCTFQVAEVTDKCEHNVLYQYDVKRDALVRQNKSSRFVQELSLFTGLSEAELQADLKEKQFIIESLVRGKVFNIERVGKTMADYYADKESLLKRLKGKN